MSLAVALISNLPSRSVTVPVVLPFIFIVAPMIGSPFWLSVTTPIITFVF